MHESCHPLGWLTPVTHCSPTEGTPSVGRLGEWAPPEGAALEPDLDTQVPHPEGADPSLITTETGETADGQALHLQSKGPG